MIFVVGSGRCGTQSVASMLTKAGLDIRHENAPEVFTPLAPEYTAGIIDTNQAAQLMDSLVLDWGDGSADFKASELITPLHTLHPEAKFLWLTRDPKATIVSLWRNGWFRTSDDDAWPIMFTRWGMKPDGTSWLNFDVNYAGHRTTAPIAGEMPWSQWRKWPSFVRCIWWWSFINRRIGEQLSQIDPALWTHVRLEDLDPQAVCEFAGAPKKAKLPWIGRSIENFEWEDGPQQQVFDALVGPVAAALGY